MTTPIFTATVPPGVTPYQRVGLNFVGQFTGDLYVDRVQIGSHAYDFQGGGTNHWETAPPFTLDNRPGVGMDGERALHVSVTPTSGTQIWMPLPEDVEAGTPITLHVYADGPGTSNLTDSLAAALRDGQSLDKPVVVDESGMVTCQAEQGRSLETAASRATKLDAKLNAFFATGGSGYLVWTWDPRSDCAYNFTSGDPLEAVLAAHAASLRSNRPDAF